MQKEVKMKRSILILTALFLGMVAAHAAYAGSYQSIHPNFKGDHTPKKVAVSGKITVQLKSVPSLFKAFVPPGTTKAYLIIYGGQNVVVGAAARVDKAPECKYVLMKPADAEKLPWDKPKSATLQQMRKKDYQMDMKDQQIEVLQWSMPAVAKPGHWLHVKILNHSHTKLALMQYTLNLDTARYKMWYDSNPFSGNNPPNTSPGPAGGGCESAWSNKGGSAAGGASSAGGAAAP